jgi:hypothetical protein
MSRSWPRPPVGLLVLEAGAGACDAVGLGAIGLRGVGKVEPSSGDRFFFASQFWNAAQTHKGGLEPGPLRA